MATPVWFTFGFEGVGPVQKQQNSEALRPRPLSLGGSETSRQRLCKLRPSWSYTAALTGDGYVILSGFVGGSPQQSVCLPGGGCRDLLTSEKYLLLLYKDRVECWDTGSLGSAGLHGEPVWKMELSEDEDSAFPAVSTGYVSPKPPFFKAFPHQLRVCKLALGGEHALLLSSQWTVYAWGSGRHGQLGHGGLEDVLEPRTVEALHGVLMGDVAAGGWHSVSVSEAGDIYVWGWNESGQLGLPCKRLARVTERTALLKEETGVGSNAVESSHGEEAQKASENISVEFISIQAFPALLDLPEGAAAHKASCGSRHTAVVTRNGSLCTWGWGSYGQLGHGNTASSDQPKLLKYFSQHQLHVQDVVCGTWSTFVLCHLKENEPRQFGL
ncbi:RCC1 domain-containing protein 1 [Microcaecilia unicolor]|uniref:RCC1 domain-containing protein 1 n=1 Tax=Microcaecilia unicolor TaxID=1415580 RepID=A0A6P7WQN9_9AMPH|nr:RCC1 domain-containing protein 1 [Microcaecilia unicolor]